MRLQKILAFAALGLAVAVTAEAKQPAKKAEGKAPVQYQQTVNTPSAEALNLSSNYKPYPYVDQAPPAQTAAPKGYEPFHIEHYGRHGSRWLIDPKQYETPVKILQAAKEAGKLTELGDSALAVAQRAYEGSRGRLGELTPLGARQHQAIARRMYENYPQVFAPGTHVDAKSTIVIRCILSMLNGVKELQALEPTLLITTDASEAEMPYMNHPWDRVQSARKDLAYHKYGKALNKAVANKGEYLPKLFNDMEYVEQNVDKARLMSNLYSVLANTQAHDGYQPWLVEEIWTPEEQYDRWQTRNMSWFLDAGNSQLTDGAMPYNHEPLLRNIIASADTAVVSTGTSANLRYGHDSIVLPLAVLLDLDGMGQEINDLYTLGESWQDYHAIPYAGNIQIIFYRPKGTADAEQVLVKVLLNEQEATLPIAPIAEGSPYYSWPAFRAYYLNKLDQRPR